LPEHVLVAEDGRKEIEAGRKTGCVTLSRLPAETARARKIRRAIPTNYLAAHYTDPAIRILIRSA